MAARPASPPSAESPRPSLRQLARLAGVSAMTASRALRNRARIATATRERVLKFASQIGYRPDPEVAKLMHHLHKRRKPVFQGVLCALTNRPPELRHHYIDEIVRGARARADALGYGFGLLQFDDARQPRARLLGVLRNKGIEGLLLLPLTEPIDLGGLLDWRNFSIVAATSSLLAPEVHRVTPHHHANTLLLCRQLHRQGYRRIGLALDETQDSRVNHAFTAAVMWHNRHAAGVDVPALIYRSPTPPALRAWFRAARPDAIVTSEEQNSRAFARILGLRLPGRVGFASLDTNPASGLAGIDEQPAKIGGTAIGLLAAMLAHGEKGIPADPTTTMVHGCWCSGRGGSRRRL